MASLTDHSAAYLLPRALAVVMRSGKSRSKRATARALMEAMGPMRRHVVQALWEVVKESATKDPDMSSCVKAQTRDMIDVIAGDVEVQVLHAYEANIGRSAVGRQPPPPVARSLGTCCCCGCCGCYLRLRAFILSRLLPCDKTLWGCVRDPVCWMWFLPSLVPFYNVRCTIFFCLLILLLFPGPADEYQLTRFIVMFKANQFITVGIGQMLVASMLYYRCMLLKRHELEHCVDSVTAPPFGLWFLLLDFAGSLLVPQLAMVAFYWSQRLVPRRSDDPIDAGTRCIAVKPKSEHCCAWPAPPRLRILHRYDLLVFIASVTILVVLTLIARRNEHGYSLVCDTWVSSDCKPDPTLVLNTYWCRVLYAFFALPFCLVWVPDFTPIPFSLITQASRTGYDDYGRCVLFAMRHSRADGRQRDTSSDSASESGSSSDSDYPSEASSARGKHRGFLGMDWRTL